MWDTAETRRNTVTHDRPCSQCGHATHTYLACSDECSCVPYWLSGEVRDRLVSRIATSVAAPAAA